MDKNSLESKGIPPQGIKRPNKVLMFILGIIFLVLFILLVIFLVGVGAIVFVFVFAFVMLLVLLKLFIRYFKYFLTAFIIVFIIGAIILFVKRYYGYNASLTDNLSLYVYLGVGLLIIGVVAAIFYFRSKRVEIYTPQEYKKLYHKKR